MVLGHGYPVDHDIRIDGFELLPEVEEVFAVAQDLGYTIRECGFCQAAMENVDVVARLRKMLYDSAANERGAPDNDSFHSSSADIIRGFLRVP
jgi:hypothetical protein